MKIFTSMFSNIQMSQVLSFIVSSLFFMIAVLAILGVLEIMIEKRRQENIKGIAKKNKYVEKLRKFTLLKKFTNHLEILLIEKNKEGIFNIIFFSVIIFIFLCVIFFINVKQILFAILVPFLILKLGDEICIRMCSDLIDNLEEQLPFAIDNIIRIFSKYGDIKSIIYEASRTCQQPVKGILENMSREMLSSSSEKVLLDYAEKYDNIWFYSVVFTLVSYLQDSSKDETTKNLKSLRNILEKENLTKKASVTEKRYSVVVNLVICGLALAGFFFNIFFVPDAKEFFFSTFIGLTCFILGIASIIATIFISINMTKRSKK